MKVLNKIIVSTGTIYTADGDNGKLDEELELKKLSKK